MAQSPCSCLLLALVPHIFIIIVKCPWQCQHFASFLSKGSAGKKLNSDTICPNFHLLWELGAVKLENGLLGWKELGWGDVVCGKTCDPCYWGCGHFESDVSTKLSMEMDSKWDRWSWSSPSKDKQLFGNVIIRLFQISWFPLHWSTIYELEDVVQVCCDGDVWLDS